MSKFIFNLSQFRLKKMYLIVQGISKNYLYLIIINQLISNVACTRCWYWLKLCTTSRKVAWSVSDRVIGIFSLTYSLRPHYYLGVDPASLTELSTKCLSWGVKKTGAMGWQQCQLICRLCRNSWSLNILEPSGPTQLDSFTNATVALIEYVVGYGMNHSTTEAGQISSATEWLLYFL